MYLSNIDKSNYKHCVKCQRTFGKNESIAYHQGLEPRISASYILSENNSIKLGYNRNYNAESKKCNCVEGYYDSGINECSYCHYSCKSCFKDGIDNCETCDSSNFRKSI